MVVCFIAPNGLRFTKPIKRLEAQMFNKPKMIDRSTYLKLPTKPFLLVLLKRVLCSRCGLSSDKLPTKHGKNELKLFLGGLFLFYITLVSFSIPKIAPMAKTVAIPFFIGVQTNGVLFFEPPPLPEVAPTVNTDNGIYANISPPCIGLGLTKDRTCGASDGFLDVNGSASTTSSAFQEYLRRPTTPPTATLVEYGFEKVYFAITIFFSMVRDKDTKNFFTFYSFEKTDRAWAFFILIFETKCQYEERI